MYSVISFMAILQSQTSKFSLYFIIDWILYIASISFLKSSELLFEVSLSALKHVLFASDKVNKRICLRLRIADSVAVHLVIYFKVSFPILNSFSRCFFNSIFRGQFEKCFKPIISDTVKLSKPPKCFLSDGFIDARILHKELLKRGL